MVAFSSRERITRRCSSASDVVGMRELCITKFGLQAFSCEGRLATGPIFPTHAIGDRSVRPELERQSPDWRASEPRQSGDWRSVEKSALGWPSRVPLILDFQTRICFS